MIEIIDRLRDRIDAHSAECDELTESDIWANHGVSIWSTNRFVGQPNFYPVYRCGDFYSHSVLALIIKKGVLNLNQSVAQAAARKGFFFLPGQATIDRDVSRIGGAHPSGSEIQDVDEYASRIANALISDVSAVEKKNPDKSNLVLCGGKDSLNLLLLPWQNDFIAVSADPNYELVRKFVEENGLRCDVIRLRDYVDENILRHEIMECCCRADLAHWRWGPHLKSIAEEFGGKMIYWKGQVGDLYMSEKWKTFMHPIRQPEEFLRKVYKRLEGPIPYFINRAIGRALQPAVIQATWDRCAALQGCHMGFIREITDSLVLSAYHGPEMIKVWSETDLGSVAQRDIRHLVGRILLGRDIAYPKENPAPEISQFRAGMSDPDKFIRALTKGGIRVEG